MPLAVMSAESVPGNWRGRTCGLQQIGSIDLRSRELQLERTRFGQRPLLQGGHQFEGDMPSAGGIEFAIVHADL